MFQDFQKKYYVCESINYIINSEKIKKKKILEFKKIYHKACNKKVTVFYRFNLKRNINCKKDISSHVY